MAFTEAKSTIRSTFRESLPIVITTFVNKCGQIGLNLIPMLIIEKGFTVQQGSTILAVVKSMALVGTFVGGLLSDRMGLRFTIFASYVCVAIGLGILPHAPTLYTVLICASVAQLGHAFFPSAARLMLADILGQHRLKEGISWFRTANNAGQIVSYSVAATLSTMGLAFFFYFDALTSALALVLGFYILPRGKIVETDHSMDKAIAEEAAEHSTSLDTDDALPPHRLVWRKIRSLFHHLGYKNSRGLALLLCTGVITCTTLTYEMIVVGLSAKTKLIHGDAGLKYFSLFMVVNTILCTLTAVQAARFFTRITVTFLMGATLIPLAGYIALSGQSELWQLFAGTLLLTLGEVATTSMAQYGLLVLTPATKSKGTIYGVCLTIQKVGTILAGAVALPLVVYHDYVLSTFAGLIALSVTAACAFFLSVREPADRAQLGMRPLKS